MAKTAVVRVRVPVLDRFRLTRNAQALGEPEAVVHRRLLAQGLDALEAGLCLTGQSYGTTADASGDQHV